MQFVIDYWLPIVAATGAMFFASFLVWTVLPHHKPDWKRLPDEDPVLATMRQQDIPAGQYMFPYCIDMKEMATDEMREKWEKGPAGFLYVLPRGLPNMGKRMGITITYQLVVNLFIAYIASVALAPTDGFLEVFRFVGTVGVLAHSAGGIPHAIWFGRSFSSTAKEVLDGVAYGLITGLVFAALW
jgi:hypothetical protein